MGTRRFPVVLPGLVVTTILFCSVLLAFKQGVSFELSDRDHHPRVAVQLQRPDPYVRFLDSDGNEQFVWQNSGNAVSLKLGNKFSLRFQR